jgi:DNA processing protein
MARPEKTETDWLRFGLVPGVPPAAQRALLKAFGTPGAILRASAKALASTCESSVAAALTAGARPELVDATLRWLDNPRHHLVTLGDDHYPKALLEIHDPPTILFAVGNLERLRAPAVAIVGSRNATRQGELDAGSFAKSLSDNGFCIVSGLALGIDAAAHRGGMAGASSSIAVVGTGLDRVYPAANRDLAHTLAEEGALLSEFPLGSAPLAANFPRRNRLISGLSKGVIVVEAALKSGSLTTARLALEQGREVFSVPGSIHSPLAKGCHWLIKQGAKLVESANDVIDELQGTRSGNGPEHFPRARIEEADPLLEAMGHAPATADAMSLRTGRSADVVAAELMRLELEGLVERLPGGLFRRLAANA